MRIKQRILNFKVDESGQSSNGTLPHHRTGEEGGETTFHLKKKKNYTLSAVLPFSKELCHFFTV